MTSSLISRLHRKDALFQLFSDFVRHNSNKNNGCCLGKNQQISTQPFRQFHQYGFGQNLVLYKNGLSLIQESRRHFSTRSTVPGTEPAVAKIDGEFNNFKELSVTDKKAIAKRLSLKLSYLQEIGLYASKDKLLLNYYFYSNNETLNSHAVYYVENRDQVNPVWNIENCHVQQNFLYNSFFNEIIPDLNGHEQRQNSNFLFLPLDSGFIETITTECASSQPVIITDNPFDALSIHQQTKLPTIVLKFLKHSPPDSDVALKTFCDKINRLFKQVYLWTTDEQFQKHFRNNCMKQFDCYNLHIVHSDQSASQLLKSDPKEKFTSMLDSSFCVKHPNIVIFDDFKDSLFEKINDPSANGVQWARFVKMNEHFKGFRPGEFTIITGPTGCGKTTFASEYSLDLCMQGVRTLWGSFEIKYDYLAEIMLTQFLRKPLASLSKEEYEADAADFSKLPLYFINFHGQTEIEKVLESAKHSVLAYGVQHLIIDNLQFVLGSDMESNVNRFQKQDYFIGSLRHFSTKYNCHVTLVAHPRKEKEEVPLSNNSLYGGVKASQEADNIMIIMNKFNARFRCNKYVQITKNRYKGTLGIVPLFFDKNSLCFSSTKHQQQSIDAPAEEEAVAPLPVEPLIESQAELRKTKEVSDFYEIRYLCGD